MGYLKTTIKGLGWMTALRGTIRLLAVVKTAILARILLPEQFGVYGVALLVLGLLEMLTETGINVFLIQVKQEIQTYLDSAWVVSILRGILIALLIVATIPVTTSFFNSPAAKNLLYIVSAIAFVRGFINPMQIVFQKKLMFNKEFVFQGTLFFVDALVAISVGYATKSESSLLFGMLAAAMLEVVLSFLIFPNKPKLSIDFNKVKKVLNDGKWITGAGIFSYFFQNIDNIVISKVLGLSQLGLYQQAYRISTLPVSEIGQIFNKVTFPIFVKISNDSDRLNKAYTKTLLFAFLAVLPFGLIMFIFSKQIILLILGPNWLQAEQSLKVLAVYGVFKSLLNSTYSLFLSVRLQKVVMLSEFAGIVGILLFIYPLTLKYGIYGAGWSVLLGSLLSLPIIFYNLPKVLRQTKNE